MLQLGIGIDNQKKMDLKHEEFLGSLQLAFIELYERGYIKYGDIDVYQDKSGKKNIRYLFFIKRIQTRQQGILHFRECVKRC